jgi:uncharacterized glyoxalase superfamily protein PhnB
MTSNGLVPLLRYRDVAAAVEWLSQAFGFVKRNVLTDPDGSVAYAELTYGRSVVMLGPVGQSVLDGLLRQPDELGGVGTQSVYVAVDDVATHFKTARAAGADIVLEFGSEEAGDRAYAARDPEGHIWNFGAYSPWPAATLPLDAAAEPAFAGRHTFGQAALGASVAILALLSVAGIFMLEPPRPQPRFAAAPVTSAPSIAAHDPEAAALKETLAREAHARQEAARTTAAVREELAKERAGRQAAEAARQELERKLAATREATDAAPQSKQVSTQNPAQQTGQDTAVQQAGTPASQTPPAELAATPAPSTGEPPATTGSLGDEPRDAAGQPADAEPAPPVTVAPAIPQTPPATAGSTRTAKPKQPVKSKPQAQKKPRPPQSKKNSGNDPFFMYD